MYKKDKTKCAEIFPTTRANAAGKVVSRALRDVCGYGTIWHRKDVLPNADGNCTCFMWDAVYDQTRSTNIHYKSLVIGETDCDSDSDLTFGSTQVQV